MKLKTPNKNSIKNTAINVTSATVGGMLSEGVVNIVPAETMTQYEPLVRGGVALTSAAVMAAIDGKDTKAIAAKWFLGGMAIKQILKLLPTLATNLGITRPSDSSSTTEKFVGGVFGLNCPCASGRNSSVVVRMPQLNGLRNPVGFPSVETRVRSKNLVTAFD